MAPARHGPEVWRAPVAFALTACLGATGLAASDPLPAPHTSRLVVVLYPDDSDGSPGTVAADRAIRSTLSAGTVGRVEIRNEYVDTSRHTDGALRSLQTAFLKQKYAGRKVDVVIAALSSALDYALENRTALFPGVPIVCCAVEERELASRKPGAGVVGVPIRMELAPTLDLALRLHPDTRQVYVVVGKSRYDAYWEGEARKAFRPYEGRVPFEFLSGLPTDELLRRVAGLPPQSVVYYLHAFQDGTGKSLVPADYLELLAGASNAPIYGHIDTFVGRGLVGGRVVTLGGAGATAARVALRILAGEEPEGVPITEGSANRYLFDGRQLRRWGISEASLPPGSVVQNREFNFWEEYRWQVVGILSLCVLETLLIVGLLVQRASRRRAQDLVRESQRDLRLLTGRLIEAQETERRRIARELHDDLSQGLALLSVEMDLLGQNRPKSAEEIGAELRHLSASARHLSSCVHDLSYQLHPLKLEQLGLVPAVRGLCQEFGLAHGMAVEFLERAVPERLPDEAAVCLYRIAQEALQNVAKHSKARHARVELAGMPNGVQLRVSDDGAGFDFDAALRRGGLGLGSMRERLRLVAGSLLIDSRPGAGTRVEVRVPLPARAANGKATGSPAESADVPAGGAHP